MARELTTIVGKSLTSPHSCVILAGQIKGETMASDQSTAQILAALIQPASREALVNSWPFTRCSGCKRYAASGFWMCQVATASGVKTTLRALCAQCGLDHNFFKCDLFISISAPPGSSKTHADKLIDRILSHPSGEAWIKAWRVMFKPANIHHPIAPAETMLKAIMARLFPPQTNKVD